MNQSYPEVTMSVFENQEPFSNALFIFQIVAAPAGGLFFGLIAGESVDALLGRGGHQFVIWLCYAIVGFAQGYLTQTAFPRADRSGGRFVWVAPVCILAIAFFDGYRHSPQTVFADFLVWNPYSFAKGFGSTVLVMPAFASCLYALGILVAKRPGTPFRG